jgi:chromate transporter
LSGTGRLTEVGGAFLRLGLVSFGGPVAHIGYFRREFVERRQWLDDAAFADMVALCQLLPGPASSQVAFAIGMRRAGLAGGLTASIAFMLPSAVLMILFAYGVALVGDLSTAGWLHGLKVAAVAVVAVALWGMATSLCPDWKRRIMAAAAATVVLLLQGSWAQVGVILLWAFIGTTIRFRLPRGESPVAPGDVGSRRNAAVALAAFGVLLVALPALVLATGSRSVELFDSFYRSGALVFGGGHVVLPLLRSELVPKGLVSGSAFLAGYGAVQAMPGPLFTFAGYLGTVALGGAHAWIGGMLALLAIFLPGWLLVAGAYPFWHRLRPRRWFQGAVRGASAAVVGILFAALCTPLIPEAIHRAADALAAAIAVVLLVRFKVPQWLLVILLAAAGQWILR